MKLRRIYNPGYQAHNGHVFTRDDCDRYNRVQDSINCLVVDGYLALEDVLDYLYSTFVYNSIINNK